MQKQLTSKQRILGALKTNDSSKLFSVLFLSPILINYSNIKLILNIGKSQFEDKSIINHLNSWCIPAILDKQHPFIYKMRLSNTCKMFELLYPYLSNNNKNKLLNMFVDGKFYSQSYLKKIWIDFIAKFDMTEEQAIKIIKNYSRVMTKKSMDLLLTKVGNGIDNPEIKKIFKKVKAAKYSIVDWNNFSVDELLRDLSKTPSVRRYVIKPISISLSDIKKLPPAARFDFLWNYFYTLIHCISQYKSYNYLGSNENILNRVRNIHNNQKWHNIVLEHIPLEDMKDMLFPLLTKKPEMVNSFLSLYSHYIEFTNDIKSKDRTTNSKYARSQ